MKTKWAVVGLFVLGLVAAATAAMIVVTLRAEGRRAKAPSPGAPVQIVVAKQALPAMSVVDSSCVVIKTVPREQAPARALQGTAQIVGKVLAVAMTEEQAFTDGCFITEGSGRMMSAALTSGMRAVSVSLSEHSALHGILHPGSVVDVLASVKVPEQNGNAQDEYVSVPLLQRVQVLAVGDQTVFSSEEKKTAGARQSRILVTLMVEPDQARILHLAAERGSLSLAMRNPLDQEKASDTPFTISDVVALHRPEGAPEPLPDRSLVPPVHAYVPPAPIPPLSATPPAATPVPEERKAAKTVMKPQTPQWQITVIRGNKVVQQSFDLKGAPAPSINGLMPSAPSEDAADTEQETGTTGDGQ